MDFKEKNIFDFEDDGKLRIVAFLGHKYLKSAPKDIDKVIIDYQGPALNVIPVLASNVAMLKVMFQPA